MEKTVSKIVVILCLALAAALFGCDSYEDEYPIPDFHEHIWGDVVPSPGNAPTCATEGRGYKYCSVCLAPSEGIVILRDRNAHDWWPKNGAPKPATCTEDGIRLEACRRQGCYTITTLGQPIQREVTVTALGHSRQIVNQTATCTSGGMGVRKCVREGCETPDPEEVTISALGHDPQKIREEPTCVSPGKLTTYDCYRAGCAARNEQVTILAATGIHNYRYDTTLPATCLTAGTQKRQCSFCDVQNYVTIPALGHDWKTLTLGKYCQRCGIWLL